MSPAQQPAIATQVGRCWCIVAITMKPSWRTTTATRCQSGCGARRLLVAGIVAIVAFGNTGRTPAAIGSVPAAAAENMKRNTATMKCDAKAAEVVNIDGIVDISDEWSPTTSGSKGNKDADYGIRCAWDGKRIVIAVVVTDDRLVRLPKTGGNEDKLVVSLAAGGAPVVVSIWPGNAMAKRRQTVTPKAPKQMELADSLTDSGFSLELALPASAVPGLSASTAELQLNVVYEDADFATGPKPDVAFNIARTIELADRSQLFADFLTTVRLRKADIVFDKLANFDVDLRGQERVVMGGTIVGVLTSQFAFVQLPAAKPQDIIARGMLPFGPISNSAGVSGRSIIYTVVRQKFDTGSRDLLMLFTVWSGQLQPLGSFEIRKQIGAMIFETTFQTSKAKNNRAMEITLTPKPATGFTVDNYQPSTEPDADSILLPWDTERANVVLSLSGMDLVRRDVAAKVTKASSPTKRASR